MPEAAQQGLTRRKRILLDVAAFLAVCAVGAAAVVWAYSITPAKKKHPAAASTGGARSAEAAGTGSAAQPSKLAAEYAAVQRLAKRGLPLYCGGAGKRMVALTFDDGPGPYTKLAIRKLRAHHLRATFFLVSKEFAAYPGEAQLEPRVAAIGDHTLTHPFLPGLSHDAMVTEIAGGQRLAHKATRQPVVLFRPPYGGRNAAIDQEAKALGMLEVLWTIDSADSLGADYAGIQRNVIAGLHPGSIILMHENHGQTIRAMLAIFAALQQKHLEAVTVPALVYLDPPSEAQLKAGPRGCGAKFSTTGQ